MPNGWWVENVSYKKYRITSNKEIKKHISDKYTVGIKNSVAVHPRLPVVPDVSKGLAKT